MCGAMRILAYDIGVEIMVVLVFFAVTVVGEAEKLLIVGFFFLGIAVATAVAARLLLLLAFGGLFVVLLQRLMLSPIHRGAF